MAPHTGKQDSLIVMKRIGQRSTANQRVVAVTTGTVI